MGNNKKFINPLTRSSEEELYIPKTTTETFTYTETRDPEASTSNEFQPLRKRGNQAFEKTHQRFTSWIDKNLKQQFEKIVEDKGVSKTSLLNEAVADLLRKYMQK